MHHQSRRPRNFAYYTSLLAVGLAGCTGQVLADEPVAAPPTTATAPTPFDARARDLLSRMNHVYKKAKSLAETLEYQATGDKGEVVFRLKFDIALRRWHEMRVVATDKDGTETTISDGQNIYTTHSRFKNEYTKEKMPTSRTALEEMLRRTGVEGAVLFLWTNDKLGGLLLDPELKSLEMGQPDVVDRVQVETVVMRFASADGKMSGTTTFFIDQNARLLKVHSVSSGDGPVTETELHSNVQIDPVLPDSAFKFTPSKGAKLVDSVKPGDRDNPAMTTRPVPSAPVPSAPVKQPQKKTKVSKLNTSR